MFKKTTSQSMTATSFNNPIDFEQDQQDAMKKTEGIQSLADQVERLEGDCIKRIELERRIILKI